MKETLAVFAAGALAGVTLLCPPVRAGNPWEDMFEQPLVKWALDIGVAKSLPWGNPAVWNAVSPGYALDKVSADAQALLTPPTPCP